jgi:L-asparagine transporter-like permease
MENSKLLLLQKKGQAGVNSKITYLVGALIVIVLAVNLAPEMFTGIATLGNETTNPDVPTWVPTILFVIIGAGLVFLIWRAFGN